MKKAWVLIIAIPVLLMFLVFGAAFVGIVYLGMSKVGEIRAEFKKQTAETVGTITDYSSYSQPSKYGSSTRSTLSFKFVVDGKPYSTSDGTSASKSDIGKQGKVCYEPSNPSNASFYFDKNRKCGQ